MGSIGKSVMFKGAALAALVALLAACASTDSTDTKASQDSGGANETVVAAIPATPGNAPAVAAPHVAAPAQRLMPHELVGLPAARLTGMMGQPTLSRVDSPAQIWQYAGRDCVMLVFLYEEAGSDLVVRHVDWLSRVTHTSASNRLDTAAQAGCLEALRNGGGIAPAAAS